MPKAKTKQSALKSHGVIVTHREKHISPGNTQILWTVAMFALILVGGALSAYVWSQSARLINEIESTHTQDNRKFVYNFLHSVPEQRYETFQEGMQAKMREMQHDYQIQHAADETTAPMAGHREVYEKIEDWSAYRRITDPVQKNLMTGCWDPGSGEELADLNAEIAKLETGNMYRLQLPGYGLIYTPRGEFPVDRFLNATCGEVGSMFIKHVYDDKIIWGGGCGGVLPDAEEDPEAYKQVMDCDVSWKIVEAFYSNP